MAAEQPDYGSMTLGQLRQRVRRGDRGAIDYQRDFGRKIGERLEPFRRFAENPGLAMPSPIDHEAAMKALSEGQEGIQRVREAKELAAVERERAMLAELTATRQALEAAEGREREALDIARRNFWAAVAAIFVAIVIAVLA